MTRRRSTTMVAAIHNDIDIDDNSVELDPPLNTFFYYLRELENKKASVREKALRSIIRILNDSNEHDNLQNNIVTSLYQILGSIKRGSANEKQLASQVLGLMAMTLSGTDNAQEIYTEALPVLTKELTAKLVDHWAFITLLDTLAMVTFFCANDSLETEAAMQIIWGFILPKSNFDVSASKQVPAIISAAISAWSFLVSTIDRWELNCNHWKGAISLLLNMLESDDDSVCVAAGEALAVIFDCQSLEKFSTEAEINSSNSSTTDTIKSPLEYSKRRELIKDITLKQLEKVSKAKSGLISLKQTFSNVARADWDVLKYFKDDKFPQTSERINGHKLTLSSWPSMIQLKFLKNFLGEEEFFKHMLENELFHNLFEFTPIYNNNNISHLYESTMEKSTIEKRVSIINKAQTKALKKSRMFAKVRKGKMYQIESEL